MAKVATDFEKIINQGRERKKNEALADKIFSKNRRQSAPSKLRAAAGPGPSLASRVGIKKRNSAIGIRANPPAGNVDGEWTHDLHHSVADPKRNSLAARISAPSTKQRGAAKRASRLSAALDRMDTTNDEQVNIVRSAAAPSAGISIKGLAGPFRVMAQNFAPGTTAADIESAMTPVGGAMTECIIVKSSPIMIVEMAFASREGGERVIETFNDKTADGRLIKVYPKVGGYPSPSPSTTTTTTKTRASRPANDLIVDGSHGFSESTSAPRTNGHSSRGGSRLYSDQLVGRGGSRRGRGFQRGGRGGL